jgi:hypothetical protein
MAGTVPRGAGVAAEADGLARLTGSLGGGRAPVGGRRRRRGLAKVADRVEVGRPEVVRLATVAHLATEVTADLTGPLPTALELAGLLHPTAAVGSAPRDAALEPFERGPLRRPGRLSGLPEVLHVTLGQPWSAPVAGRLVVIWTG